ncbi:MAG TPA: hypothetical protein VGA94_05990 [Thermodesulfobacteriota bacterium]
MRNRKNRQKKIDRNRKITKISDQTERFHKILEEIGKEAKLDVVHENPLRPHVRKRSERTDVVFQLPSGTAILWVEIDNRPIQAAHNTLKIFEGNLT